MKTLRIIFAIVLSFAITEFSISQVPSGYLKSELRYKLSEKNSSNKIEDNFKQLTSIEKPGEKSPFLGALFSGVIPGTGEFYAKSYIKGAIFLAIEAGLWIAYSSFQSKGNDQTDAYQLYANQNWDVYKYGRWLKEQNFTGSDGIDLSSNKEILRRQINVCESQNFSHQLPPYGEQQYYELIGKYQNFVTGWADADLMTVNRNNYGTYKTQMFIDYSYNRQEANSYYDKGTTTLTIVILNHILSSADAAWSVSMFNKSLKVKTGIHLENNYSFYGEKKLIPVANLRVTF
ncbi:MAG: hypothetical protein ABI462_02295 [Ignavibacteria bacterium]